MSADGPLATVSPLLARSLPLLASPCCGRGLDGGGAGELVCAACRHRFAVEEGIPLLFWPNQWDGRQDVTETVRAFYEKTPFPDYEDLDSAQSLSAKAEKGVLARLLDQQIPPGARVLEVGCGTGQMSNFLGLTAGREVFGADLCHHSLRLAEEFRRKNRIDGAAFVQMNLFRPPWREASFHFVIANGVLHHTSDPALALAAITRLLVPGGYVVVGLYNRYGRIWTDLRRALFRLGGDRLRGLDRRLADPRIGARRREAWFQDQYRHPHESKHTLGEVQAWFGRSGLTWVNGIPKARAGERFSASERLFVPSPPGNRLDHALVQLRLMLTAGNEGGFFVSIGRKRPGDGQT